VQIKQFSGSTIDEVLDQVRAELGEGAVILKTRRVVKGGVGGFFGREGIEVTAAEGMPEGEASAANIEAAASVAAPQEPQPAIAAPAVAPAPAPAPEATPFLSHLGTRLAAAEEAEDDPAMAVPGPAASPAAAYARGGATAPARPFAPGDAERTQAILEAARAAVREAHAAAPAAPLPVAPEAEEDDAPFVPATTVSPAIMAATSAPAAPAANWPSTERPIGRSTKRASAAGSGAGADGVRAELLRAGVDERYLDPFLEGFGRTVVPFLDPSAAPREAIKEFLAARLPVVRDWKARAAGHAIAVVGQSGVGKTSAAARIAGAYRAAGLSVTLVAAGAGPHDALEGHARRLDVQLNRAADGRALADLRLLLADRDVVIVDTAGVSHQSLAEVEELAALLAPAKLDEVHLVLPAATPLADLGDVQRRFRMVGFNRIVMTKLDETRFHGNLVNVPLRMGKPLAYLADSPVVAAAGREGAGGIAPADARRVAELLLP
jgi:flagellar biosynthesis protein FlhF